PIELVTHETSTAGDRASVVAHVRVRGEDVTVTGEGNGPIAAFVHALRDGLGIELDVVDYSEHAVSAGADAEAVAYVETTDQNGDTRWGVGIHASILTASLQAVVSALNGR
ncbi:MAG TPA: alpha-isopropylmalate synthase regulatory domain-containing protein, partial [Mycobacteriales bacterium]|nr:alpha-isopropylmalate synthase regulatory domain-containing protein [Mycobacteriales bacterium]